MSTVRELNRLADTICRAWKCGRRTPLGVAVAIDAAGLLMSPEVAAELEALRARVAELEAAAGDGSTRTVDEDPITYALTEEASVVPGPCRNASPYGRRCDQSSGHDGDHGMADGAGGHFGWPASDDPSPEALHASSGAVIETPARSEDVSPQVQKLRALLAGQRDVEDPHPAPCQHPKSPVCTCGSPSSVCRTCGDGPEQWCTECGACAAGCDGGHDEGCSNAAAVVSDEAVATVEDAARECLATGQLAEDPHDSPLHHEYALGRDLPEPRS